MITAPQHPVGVHHIAFMAGDMKKQLEFFTQVLGFPLVAIFEMHGVEGAAHAFLKMSDDSLFSLVYVPGGEAIPTTMGVTHAGRGEIPCAPGVMQHIAFRVPDEAALYAMRDRVRSHGVPIVGPIDHGFCKSLYFAGPEHMTLEIATQYRVLDAPTWVDPDVLASLGVSAAETAVMVTPPAYTVRRTCRSPRTIRPSRTLITPRNNTPRCWLRPMQFMKGCRRMSRRLGPPDTNHPDIG
jgi:catechol 2,3-dioxygenase-like lactoylglutathione lyase family enzyme